MFSSLRGFHLSWLPRDATAGLMLLAIALPGQLATARLAGMPPESGIVAFIAGSLAFAAFGASRFMSVGADSTTAPIFAGVLAALAAGDPARYAGLAGTLALMVGTILIVVGVLRAGWIADLLSVPVTVGFLAGIAVHIIVGQLPGILGVDAGGGHVLRRLSTTLRLLPQANLWSGAIGALVLTAVLAGRRIGARMPGAMIGLLLAATAVWQFSLDRHGVTVLGALSMVTPSLSLPALDFSEIGRLLPLAVTVALVCMMQIAAVARSFPSDADAEEDVSRDFAGVGVGSLLAGILGAFVVNASPPSTAVIAESGGRSQLAPILAVLAIVLLLALAGPAFAYVPVAALSAVLVFIGLRLVRVGAMLRIARDGGLEIVLVIAAAVLVVALPIESGMVLSVLLSLMHSVYTVARPVCAELVRLPGTTVWWLPAPGERGEREPGILVFAPAAPINFTNAGTIQAALTRVLAATATPVRLVVIDASGIAAIDYTGAQSLKQTITQLRDKGTDVAMARLGAARAQRAALATGLIEALGPNHLFHSVEEAIRELKSKR